MNMKKAILVVIILIIIVNLPPVNGLTGHDDLLYSNANGSFTFDEANYAGRNFQLCMDNFQAFKSTGKKDTLLFRVTPRNVFKFWRWRDYLTKEKYNVPYKSWKEIELVRGPVGNRSAWQAF
jgi:hypothetical protein